MRDARAMRCSPTVRVVFSSIALLALASFACVSRASAAAGAHDPVGHWQGSLQGMVRIVVHIERRGDGSLHGALDSPDQGAMGLALDSLVFAGDSLRFALRMVGGGYAARMNTTGDTLVGAWSQLGQTLPLALARTSAPPEPRRTQRVVPPYPYDTLAVSIANAAAPGVTLAGTLTLPRGKGPFPAAILITGSGGQDRDETVFGHRPFRVLADHLTRNGIAVLRVDDRGVGGSTGKQAGATSEDFATDVIAGMDWLAKRPDIAKRKIGLIGHSEGGLIAPIVARQRRDVGFVVLLAGPGLRGDSLMILQSTAVRRAYVSSEEALGREAAAIRVAYGAAIANDSAGVVAAVRSLVDLQLGTSSGASGGTTADRENLVNGAVRQIWSPWFRYFLAHDPAADLAGIRCPVLALNGDRDVQVVAKENLDGITNALRAGGNKDVTVMALPGLNHLFQACTACTVGEYAMIEETISPSALETVSGWIRRHTGLAP
jgi:pimeloyl-ACP methyl ester carboxylesterase